MKNQFTFPSLRKRRIKTLLIVMGFMSMTIEAQLPTAQEVAGQMKVGWNLGNTLEAICSEDAWGGGGTSQALIDGVKAQGFNTVRIPCSWDCHSTNGVIDAAWIARVKEVVDYCINANMYTILNIHWDGGWLDDHINATDQASVIDKQKNYWTQIANYFKNYNEHLLFAGSNEPPAKDAAQMSILLSYHQAFIDAVRATGGNNSSRTLVIQGPSTDTELTYSLMNTMPNDNIANRLMVEVHYYTPWQFCGLDGDASWGNMFFYWGEGNHSTTDASRNTTWGEEDYMETALGNMKTKFIDNGIPVIIGEYGAFRRDLSQYNEPNSDQALHDASIEYYYRYFVKSAMSKGIITYAWDVPGWMFNHTTGALLDSRTVNAIMEGAAGASTSTGIVSGGTYRILARHSGKSLDITNNSTADGAIVEQWTYGGGANQQFVITDVGSGYYRISPASSTSKAIDVNGNSTADGASIIQWTYGGGYNQQWQFVPNGSYYNIKSRSSGKCLDVYGWSSDDGAAIVQWTCGSGNNQQFSLTRLSSADAATTVESNGIIIYPNPLTGAEQLRIDGLSGESTINIIDFNGRIVRQDVTNEQQTTLDVNFKPGMYFVQIKNNDKTSIQKLVVK